MAYLPKSTKSNDVASGKTIKTAVETAMSSEDTYCYLTGTDDYSYIYIYPGSTSENDIVLDVDYIPNEYYGIVSSDVEGDIKREIFNNIGEKMPAIKYTGASNPSIGKPVCYVVAVSNRGTVSVYMSTVSSGFFIDSYGYTDCGYELCPETDWNYQ